MSLLKNIGKLFKTGRSAAKRAENAANQFAAQAQANIADTQRKTKRERDRAQKLAIRGLRSKRSASYFGGGFPQQGSDTIG